MKTKTAIVTGLLLATALSANAFSLTKSVRVGESVTLPSSVEYDGNSYAVQWDKQSVNTETEGMISVKGNLLSGEECNLYIIVQKNPSVLSEMVHNVSYSLKNLNVKTNIAGDNSYAAISVYAKDDLKGLDFKNYDVTAAIAVQAEKITDGAAEFNIDLSEFSDGTYVYFISSGEETLSGEFVYRDADSYVESVLSASGEDLGANLVTLYNNYNIIIELSLRDVYDNLSSEEKETVMINMHKTVTKTENAMFDDIQAAIDRETAMIMYLKADDKRAFLENLNPDYASPLGIDVTADGYYERIDGKDRVISYITKANPTTSDGLYKNFYEAVAITAMNECTKSDVYDILKDFDKVGEQKILGIRDSLKKLDEKLTDSQKNDVLSKMAAVDTYTSTADISKKLASEIASATNTGNGSGGSGTGGSSGNKGNSTGTGGSTAYIPSGVNTEKTSVKFDDIDETPWAEIYITALAEKNIVNGNGNKFRPNDPVTRAEFSKILVNILGIPQCEYIIQFTDVNKTDWYADYVNRLFAAGIINGVSETEFDPDGFLTREDMCVLVCRAKQYLQNIDISSANLGFADNDAISDYAVSAVAYLQEKGIVNGVGENMFMPKSVCSRAAVCKVAAQFFDIK